MNNCTACESRKKARRRGGVYHFGTNETPACPQCVMSHAAYCGDLIKKKNEKDGKNGSK